MNECGIGLVLLTTRHSYLFLNVVGENYRTSQRSIYRSLYQGCAFVRRLYRIIILVGLMIHIVDSRVWDFEFVQ